MVNSSLIDQKATRDDLNVYYIPANDAALELDNNRVANMIMLGAYLKLTGAVKKESIIKAFKKVFGPTKEHLLPLNEKALEKGESLV